jgi:periplasmic protein CpxP/Spy
MKIHHTRLILAAALAGLLHTLPAASAAEQTASDPKPTTTAPNERGARARDQMQQIAKELNLTEEQKTQLKPVIQKQAEKARALRADTSLSREERQAKLKTLRAELAPEFKKVLTPEQYEKWQKLRDERQRGGGPNAPKKAKASTETK